MRMEKIHLMKSNVSVLFVLIVLIFAIHNAHAQLSLPDNEGADTNTTVDNEPDAVLNTPRDTVRAILISLANPTAYDISENFITRPTDELSRETIGRVIEQFPYLINSFGVLDPVALVSDNPEGTEEVTLASEFERVGHIRADGIKVPIILERVTVRTDEMQWLVSRQTIKAIATLNITETTSVIDMIIPPSSNESTWRSAPVRHWLAIPIILGLTVFVSWLLYKALSTVAKKYDNKTESSRNAQILSALVLPLCMIAGVFIFYWQEIYLGLSIIVRQDMSKLTVTVFWLALFITIWSLLDNFSTRGEHILREKKRGAAVSLVIFFRAIAKTFLVIVAIILILTNYGVDVTTGLAALGLGGIAIALGAQKAIENIVGSIIIIIDHPFRIGDFCKVGELVGTVEHIGLRSTRLRTLTDTLVTYPNGELSSTDIENFTMRKRFLFRTTLNLRYETSSENVENILHGLRTLLREDKHVLKKDLRVRFISYSAASKDIEIFTYISAADYAQFLERQERLLLSLDKIVEQYSGFAFPSQTIYLAKDAAP